MSYDAARELALLQLEVNALLGDNRRLRMENERLKSELAVATADVLTPAAEPAHPLGPYGAMVTGLL